MTLTRIDCLIRPRCSALAQGGYQFMALVLTLGIAMLSGLAVGILIRIDVWGFLENTAYSGGRVCCVQAFPFEDDEFWHIPSEEDEQFLRFGDDKITDSDSSNEDFNEVGETAEQQLKQHRPGLSGGTTAAHAWDRFAAVALAAVEETVVAALGVAGPLTGRTYMTQVVAGACVVCVLLLHTDLLLAHCFLLLLLTR